MPFVHHCRYSARTQKQPEGPHGAVQQARHTELPRDIHPLAVVDGTRVLDRAPRQFVQPLREGVLDAIRDIQVVRIATQVFDGQNRQRTGSRLLDVRRAIGPQTVLFGNIEASEIELLPPPRFEARVRQALEEGTAGEGRGFVLMPSACPYGRHISADVTANYETMVRLAKEWQ